MTEHDLIYGETILSKDSFKTLEETVNFYKKEIKRFGKKLNKAIDKMENKKKNMKIKVGQVYTFNNNETYDVIIDIKKNGEIWYQIWQIKDLTYWDEKTKSRVVWSKAMPNNEGIFVDIEVMTKQEFIDLFNKGMHGYGYDCNSKLLGEMNKDFGLNDDWRLVPIDKATRKWKLIE